MDLESRAHGARRVVSVGHRRAEQRHDRIADVLVHPAAESFDHLIHGVEEAAHQAVQLLCVDLAAERGEAHQIGEKDRHLAPFALGPDRRRFVPDRRRFGADRRRLVERLAATAAELTVFRVGETAVRTGARQGCAAAAAKAVGSRVLEVATGTLHGHAL